MDLLKGSNTLSPTDFHIRAPKDSEYAKKLDVKNGKSVVQDLQEGLGQALGKNIMGGISSKVNNRKAEDQMRQLAKMNSEIMSESLRKMVYREEGLSMSQLY